MSSVGKKDSFTSSFPMCSDISFIPRHLFLLLLFSFFFIIIARGLSILPIFSKNQFFISLIFFSIYFCQFNRFLLYFYCFIFLFTLDLICSQFSSFLGRSSSYCFETFFLINCWKRFVKSLTVFMKFSISLLNSASVFIMYFEAPL